jgi:hypothetical protein
VPQQLTPEGKITRRQSGAHRGRKARAGRSSDRTVHACDGKRRIGRGRQHLHSDLSSLLGGQRRGLDQRSSQQQLRPG